MEYHVHPDPNKRRADDTKKSKYEPHSRNLRSSVKKSWRHVLFALFVVVED